MVVCQAGPRGGNRVVLFPDGGSGVNVLLLFFFFFNPAFPSQARELIIRVLLISFLACPSKYLGQSSRILSSLFYPVLVGN